MLKAKHFNPRRVCALVVHQDTAHNCMSTRCTCRAGVEALDCYCVDNALARLGDPLFLGYCHAQAAQVGARVVAKAHPDEKVGRAP
jgi:hypothetical protein